MRRLPALLLAVALLPAAAAHASATQESMFQDDDLLEFAPAADVAKTLDTLKGLGVDRLRVTVYWRAVAPLPDEQTRPKGFDGSNPDNYPDAKWDRYDTLVKLAAARGLGVMFDIAGPAPRWATPSHRQRQDLDDTWDPDRTELNAFVRAVAQRYTGSFVARADRPKTIHHAAQGVPGLPGYQAAYDETTAAGPPLPRVAMWELWNEPNQPGWLDPQWTRRGKRRAWVPSSPRIYREMADAMYAALQTTGHGTDTILVGVTSPKGLNVKGISRGLKPLLFIRELYCVDRNNQAYRGAAATYRGCPTGKDALARFAAAHPVLFKAGGYAHHPYELTFAPNHKPSDPLYLTIANLGKLSDALRRAWLRYGQPVPRGGVPLYLTEFGYQTNPPDRFGVSPVKQARYLAQAEYIAYRNRAVRALSQFLLVDGGEPVGLTFQSGLRFRNGRDKPALAAYRLPFWIPKTRVRRGRRMRVWGLVRPAANGTAPTVTFQFRRSGSRRWRTLGTATGSADRGYVDTTIRAPGTGSVRYLYNGRPSRSIAVRG